MITLTNAKIIKDSEGLRLEAYMPTANDVPTIGWGHTRGVKMGDVISLEQAEAFFKEDTAWAVGAVNRLVSVPLNVNQADALISWVFNIGESAFSRSTLLKKLNAGNYDGAADELLRWDKQEGKVLKGLVRRRAEERELFLTPTYTPEPTIVDEPEPLKPLTKSKEMGIGVTAIASGCGAVASTLEVIPPLAANILVSGITALLVVAGILVVWNRLYARKVGER